MEQVSRRLLLSLTGAFFISGFSALLYQVVWQRILGLFSGSDVRSVSIVTSAYLLGLGVGSLAGTTIADRLSSRRAVAIYGLCNMGIAIFAFLSRFLYYDVLFLELNTLARSPIILLVIVFMSLLFPTTLMGLSLPLLSKALVRSVENAARLISILYGINTLGAGIGTVVSGWYLAGKFGYEGTVYIGAGLSLLVALIAFLIFRYFPSSDRTQNTTGLNLAFGDVPSAVWEWCLLVFLSGFIVFSLELVWFRVLDVTLRSNAYTFAHLLFFFLVGDALGSLLGARYVQQITHPRRVFLWLLGATALYSVLSIWGVSLAARYGLLAEYIQQGTPAIQLDFQENRIEWLVYLLLPSVLLLPPALMIGFYFPVVQKAVQTDVAVVGQRVGLVNVANILGNTLGGILTGTVLFDVLGTVHTLRLIAVMGSGFICLLLLENLKRRNRIAGGILASVLIISTLAFPSGETFWSKLHGIKTGEQFFVAENSTGVAAIRQADEHTFISANGSVQGVIPISPTHAMLGIMPALVHPDPKNIMVIGIGSAGTSYSIGVNPQTEYIKAVEIVGSELDLLEDFNSQMESAVFERLLHDPRYEIIVGDGRRELALSDAEFDIIEADAIRPFVSHSGLLYSKEFFEMARSKLANGGIMAQWSPTARVRRTFISVFPYVVNMNDWLLLGSNNPIYYDPAVVIEKLQTPEIQAYLAAAGMDVEILRPYIDYEPEYWTPDTPRDENDINTDLFPKDEYYLNNPND